MKKPLSIIITFILFSMPPIADAFDVTYLHPNYVASDFLTLSFPAAAIEFDFQDNLYTEDANNWGTGEIRTATILKLYASTGYSTSSVYTSFLTKGRGINGLDFDESGSLFVSEFRPGLDTGIIREIDTATRSVIDTVVLSEFRPTGIAAAPYGNIYFPGRLNSVPDFGNIYQIDVAGTLDILMADIVGTGIAANDSGMIFFSTPRIDVFPLRSQSIYMLDPVSFQTNLIATFDDVVEELNFDSHGNLYALERFSQATDRPKIIQLSPVLRVEIGVTPCKELDIIRNCDNENRVIAVAIFTTDYFDVEVVDHTEVIFEGASEIHLDEEGEPERHELDVDGDGDIDLVFHFRLGETDLTCDSEEATLTGETFDDRAIEGTASVLMEEGGGK